MDGIRIKYNGIKSVRIKAFIGKSRTHFTYAEGIFRGVDGEININDLLSIERKTKFIIGGGFVSRYQERSNVIFKLPQNVGAFSGRININHGRWQYYSEFAYKTNDPANVLSKQKMNLNFQAY